MKKESYRVSELRKLPVHEVRKPKKRIGKVHSFIFHPHKRRLVGFTVKRPDIALMMHRPELFVAFDRFDIEEGIVLIDEAKESTGQAACKRLGVKWDECVMWQGLPLLTEAGEAFGFVGDVRFRASDGLVESLLVDRGASAEALLGTTEVPGEYIQGFKLGVGAQLTATDDEDFLHGAIIIAPEALALDAEGGLAQRAGEASAVVGDKVSKIVDKAKPTATHLAQKTEKAVNKGAQAAGEQISKTKGMFAAFKEEYQRALDDGEGGSKESDPTVAQAASKSTPKAKGMFAAFKEGYKQGRYDEKDKY